MRSASQCPTAGGETRARNMAVPTLKGVLASACRFMVLAWSKRLRDKEKGRGEDYFPRLCPSIVTPTSVIRNEICGSEW